MPRQYLNNAGSTLLASIGTSATTIEVENALTRIGNATVSDPIRLTLSQGSLREVVEATALSGNIYTVTRAVEVCRPDTVATAYSFTAGARVEVKFTASSALSGAGSTVFSSGRLPFTHFRARLANGDGATGFTNIGQAPGTAGTETGRALAGTSAFTARFRNALVSAASASSAARITHATAYYNTATASRSEGFAMWAGFAISDAVFSSDGLLFCGMHSFNGNLGALGTSDEFVGLYAAPGASNFAIVSNNGVAPITSVDLGANFPCNTTGTDWYEFALWKAAGVTVWNYDLINATSGQRTSGTITTDVPDFDGVLHCHLTRNTGVGTAAVAFDYNILACTRLFGIV